MVICLFFSEYMNAWCQSPMLQLPLTPVMSFVFQMFVLLIGIWLLPDWSLSLTSTSWTIYTLTIYVLYSNDVRQYNCGVLFLTSLFQLFSTGLRFSCLLHHSEIWRLPLYMGDLVSFPQPILHKLQCRCIRFFSSVNFSVLAMLTVHESLRGPQWFNHWRINEWMNE